MGNLSYTNANALTDKLTANWNALVGTESSGYGIGDGVTFGAAYSQASLATIFAGLDDIELEDISSHLASGYPSFSIDSFFNAHYSALLKVLNRIAAASNGLSDTIVDWDSFLYWYNFANASSYWQALAAPDYREAMLTLGVTPNPLNVYLEVLTGAVWQGNTFTNALGKLVIVSSTPTTTLGYVIDPTKFAGGFAYVNVTAYTGSAGTLTVHGLDQAGNAEIWTHSLSTTGRVLLTPTNNAFSLITKVTSITLTVATAATLTIEANRPSGRTNPPT